jgi:trigger factor
MRRAGQAGQARERALDAVLSRIEIPLPEKLIDQEVENRWQSLTEQLGRSNATMEDYLEGTGMTHEALQQDFEQDARRSVKAGFILDKLAVQEELGVESAELNAYVTEQAYRLGVSPDRLARQLAEHNQLNAVVADVLRAKALSLITERATVTDEAGREVDLSPAMQDEGGAESGELAESGESPESGEPAADGESAADGEPAEPAAESPAS